MSEKAAIKQFFEKLKLLILPAGSNNYTSKFLQSNTVLYCVVLLLVIKISVTLISVNLPQNIFFADITKFSLENYINQTRQSFGLQPLSENVKLTKAAQLKAENMVQNQYFDHTSPSGITPWFWFLQAGYNYKYAGENLAIGFYDSKEVYEAWLNSPSHKANIVNPNYTEVGTAVLSGFGPNNSIVAVQEFGSPQPAKTAAAPQAPKTNIISSEEGVVVGQKVLSQSTESENTFEAAKAGNSDIRSKIMNFVLYNYDWVLQDIIYGVSLVIIGILFTLIFLNFRISFKKELVLRSVLIVALLSAAIIINKNAIISLIPHQVII